MRCIKPNAVESNKKRMKFYGNRFTRAWRRFTFLYGGYRVKPRHFSAIGQKLRCIIQREQRHMQPDGIARLDIFLYRVIAMFFGAVGTFSGPATFFATIMVAGHLHCWLRNDLRYAAMNCAYKHPRVEEYEECKCCESRGAFHTLQK